MMDDLISRQAAIDKVDRIVKVNHLNPDMVWFTPNGVKTLMEDLPSAEPDDAEANYWHEKANSYEQTLVKLAQSMAEQPEPKNGKWMFCPNCGAMMEGER